MGRWRAEEARGDAGQMGVNADAGGRVEVLRAGARSVDGAAERGTGEERVED